jgi:hypothetical protein
MAIYVYATEACREEARKHSVEPQLDRIIRKVESDQSYSQFQPFPSPFLVKKKFGMFIGRLIAQVEEVDGRATGQLTSFAFNEDGTLVLKYSNEDEVKDGRVAMALFTNTWLMQRCLVANK